MIEGVPSYISLTFLITVFAAVIIFISALKRAPSASFAAKALVFGIPFWMIFQAALAIGGFYQFTSSVPPRLMLFGPFLAMIAIATLFLFARESLITNLPIKTLTIIHIVRVPIEFVLLWLFQAGQLPLAMTYHGYNFDILSGITAPIVYWAAFRKVGVNKMLLTVWNCLALVLLVIIVSLAIAAFPSPMQTIAFDQPNRAVIFFPYVWLPTLVVPIVLFCHLASLYKLLTNRVS